MLRLAEQGLVKGEPQQGFQVVDLSVEDLRDLTDARLEFESLTLRHALVDGDIEWESRLMAAHHRLSRSSQLDTDDPQRLNDDWVAAHAEIHHTLLDGCANQRLKDIAESLRDAAELYRRWSVPLGQGSPRDVASEHAAILAAVLARDADRAVECLRSHIEYTTNVLLASLTAEPVLT
jgi:DNA-binding GntR family transcriptional regulator